MCKNVIKKLPFVIRSIPDWYKTQEMCDKVILENEGTFMFVSECYKNQKMCNKAIDNYADALEFISEWYKSNKISAIKKWNKAVGIYPSAIQFGPECYKIQERRDKAVDHFPPALKFVSVWFVTSKLIKKLDDAIFANDNIIFIN